MTEVLESGFVQLTSEEAAEAIGSFVGYPSHREPGFKPITEAEFLKAIGSLFGCDPLPVELTKLETVSRHTPSDEWVKTNLRGITRG